jgi:Tol biopolymer transport system component
VLAADEAAAARIETFPKKGYRFTADVQEAGPEISPASISGGTTDSPIRVDVGTMGAAADVHDDSGRLPRKTSFYRNKIVLWPLGIALATAMIFAMFQMFRSGRRIQFSEKTTAVSRSTNVGRVFFARVSPDGDHLVYGREDKDGRFSIWLKLVGSASETEVLGPTKGEFFGASFLPDGKSIVYGARLPDSPPGSFVMPLFGGSSTRLPLTRAFKVVFSPNGDRLAYLLNDLPTGKTHLMVADADGTDERIVTTRQAPNYYWTAVELSWSRDGKRVVCVAQNANEGFPRLVEIDIDAGTETPLTDRAWASIRGVEWMHDGSGLIISAAEENSSIFQIWHLSYPGFEPTKITNDVASYFGISLSNDDRVLVTTERKRQSSIWTVPVTGLEGGFNSLRADTTGATRISSSTLDGADTVEGFGGVAWTPDGRIVFTSEEAGNGDIWVMNADGTGRRQLTTDRRKDTGPALSPDGKMIAFMSTREGTESIWMMGINGEDQRRFTFDLIERAPVFSPDGKWLYFVGWRTGKGCVWRIPVDGGEMENVVPEPSHGPSLSPDGRWLVYFSRGQWTLHDLSGERAGQTIEGIDGPVVWPPFPNTISFIQSEADETANVWIKNIETGETRKLTDLPNNELYGYDWSPDGTKLAIIRQTIESDVVVMKTQ